MRSSKGRPGRPEKILTGRKSGIAGRKPGTVVHAAKIRRLTVYDLNGQPNDYASICGQVRGFLESEVALGAPGTVTCQMCREKMKDTGPMERRGSKGGGVVDAEKIDLEEMLTDEAKAAIRDPECSVVVVPHAMFDMTRDGLMKLGALIKAAVLHGREVVVLPEGAQTNASEWLRASTGEQDT